MELLGDNKELNKTITIKSMEIHELQKNNESLSELYSIEKSTREDVEEKFVMYYYIII